MEASTTREKVFSHLSADILHFSKRRPCCWKIRKFPFWHGWHGTTTFI
eukprot:14107.XXX_149372_149166_1 [CDS] Oithona nana genome sequencing.